MRDQVEKAQKGSLDAFGLLVDHYKDMAYGAAYAILGNFHDAQDTTQEAFLRAWQGLDGLRDADGFPAWLYRITRNLSLDRVRRSHDRAEPIDNMAHMLAAPANTGPVQRAEQGELRETVSGAIQSLSEPNRLATALFYINQYSVAEVAEFLEVPVGTVKRRLHDSRSQLRERLNGMVEDTFKSLSLPEEFSREMLQRIGDCLCLETIGAGPMGSVHKCEHPVFKHTVAIKILAEGHSDGLERFRASLAALGKLNHPGFGKSFYCGEHAGRPYIVSEYLEGQVLQARGSDGELRALWDILRIMTGLSDAVAHAHKRGVEIGHLCPVNIIIVPNGAPVIVGGAGEDKCSMYADIWSLGVLMYGLLGGEPIFLEGDYHWDVPQAMEDPQPVDLSALKSQVPGYVLSVLETCLEKAPDAGFPSATALLHALEEAQFADLVRLKHYNIQRLLGDVEPGRIAAALEGAAEEITAHILSNMDEDTADCIRREMTDHPPTANTAHAARRAIVGTTSRLLEEQRISF
jgi:RNA polymerase sigma-70 factor (ECF subfamily)